MYQTYISNLYLFYILGSYSFLIKISIFLYITRVIFWLISIITTLLTIITAFYWAVLRYCSTASMMWIWEQTSSYLTGGIKLTHAKSALNLIPDLISDLNSSLKIIEEIGVGVKSKRHRRSRSKRSRRGRRRFFLSFIYIYLIFFIYNK